MIELNSKTQQDFLNREWVQRLLDAGVDMSDAKYCIFHIENINCDLVTLRSWLDTQSVISWDWNEVIPTYSTAELLYKLHEWIYPTIDGKQLSGGLKFCKDAPIYIWYYDLKDKFTEEGKSVQDYIYAEAEYPIESLAMLLIQCHKKDIGVKTKNTGDISDK